MAIDSITVVGPTASGKTHRAVLIADTFNGEIISADSRQVYRGMTIGTGKDLNEYGNIKYHLIDICDCGEKYNLYRYLSDFSNAYNKILADKRVPVICGGTGMYVEQALNGINLPKVDPNHSLREKLAGKNIEELTEILKKYKVLHNTTDIDTCQRAIRAIEIEEYYRSHPELAENVNKNKCKKLNSLVIGIDIPRDKRRELISKRLIARLEEGLVQEVQELMKKGISAETLIYYGLEYKFVTLYLQGITTYQQMVKDLETAIHQFAKRQMTWFRGMEKRGIHINWIQYNITNAQFIEEVKNLLD